MQWPVVKIPEPGMATLAMKLTGLMSQVRAASESRVANLMSPVGALARPVNAET
jgi:hypothetical protein